MILVTGATGHVGTVSRECSGRSELTCDDYFIHPPGFGDAKLLDLVS